MAPHSWDEHDRLSHQSDITHCNDLFQNKKSKYDFLSILMQQIHERTCFKW